MLFLLQLFLIAENIIGPSMLTSMNAFMFTRGFTCQFSVPTFDRLTRHVNDEYRSNAMGSLESPH